MKHKIKAGERYSTQTEELDDSIWLAASDLDAFSAYDADNYFVIVDKTHDLIIILAEQLRNILGTQPTNGDQCDHFIDGNYPTVWKVTCHLDKKRARKLG